MSKQKNFPIVGIRIPAAETKRFPKRSTRLTLAIDPEIKSKLKFIARSIRPIPATVSQLAMMILVEYVQDQALPGEPRLRGVRKVSA